MKVKSLIIDFSLFLPLLLVSCFPGALLAGEPAKEPIMRIEIGMHTATINRISIDREGILLATASNDKTVRIWDAKTGLLIRIIRPPIGKGEEGKLYAVALSPDGKTFAVGGSTGYEWDRAGEIYIFDAGTGRLVRRLTGIPNLIKHLAFSRDGGHLVACLGGSDGIRIYRTDDFSLAMEDKSYGSDSYSADFDSAGCLVTTSYDGYLRLYDAGFRLVAKEKALGGKQPYAARFSPNGWQIAVGFNDTTAVNILSGQDLSFEFAPNTQGVNNGNLSKVAWSADGRHLYAGGVYAKKINNTWTRPIRTWSDGGLGSHIDFPAADNTITDLQPRQDGGLFFSAADPAFGAFGTDVKSLYARNPAIADFRAIQDGFQVSSDGAVIRFAYDVLGKSPAFFFLMESLLTIGPKDSKDIDLTAPRTKGQGLKSTDWLASYTRRIISGTTPKHEQYERPHALAVAPDGQTFLIGTEWTLRLFNEQGQEIWRVPVPMVASSVNITGDGRLALAALTDGTIRWYNMKDGKEVLAFLPHKDKIRWVLWTPEGFFDASPGGAELIGYHLNQGKGKAALFVGADKICNQFYRPDIVMYKFQGKDITEHAKAMDVNRLLMMETFPPMVRLTTTSGTRQKQDAIIEREVCD